MQCFLLFFSFQSSGKGFLITTVASFRFDFDFVHFPPVYVSWCDCIDQLLRKFDRTFSLLFIACLPGWKTVQKGKNQVPWCVILACFLLKSPVRLRVFVWTNFFFPFFYLPTFLLLVRNSKRIRGINKEKQKSWFYFLSSRVLFNKYRSAERESS